MKERCKAKSKSKSKKQKQKAKAKANKKAIWTSNGKSSIVEERLYSFFFAF
jgi:hypothetical protein